jgi:hypothetical protein
MAMNDNNELETRIAALERRLAEHENMRNGAFDALKAVQSRVMHLQQRISAPMPPAVEAARESMSLERLAVVLTEQRALREYCDELSSVVIEDHTILREIVTLLRRNE